MAQLTIYNNDPANVTVTVVDGPPPVDQSALVAQLQAKIAAGLTSANSSVTAAQAALTAAQAVVTALS